MSTTSNRDGTNSPLGLTLTGDSSTLDALRPVFLGRRPQHRTMESSVEIDATAGVGGLAVRFDEWHHYEIEVGDGQVTARAVVATLRQEWTAPAPADRLTLHLDAVSAGGDNFLDMLTSDRIVLGFTGPDGVRSDLAQVDGRYLSQETAASFTGRVLGLYAVSGSVDFGTFRYHGTES